MNLSEAKRKGWDSEAAFREMLDRGGIPYLPFCDNMDKFSPALRDYFKTKRPDVMVLLRYVGFILVDIKHKYENKKYQSFLFDELEVDKYAHFRETFGHEIWYAVSNKEEEKYEHWYWIPALHVMKNRKIIDTKEGKCYTVPAKECIRTESMEELFKTLFGFKSH